MDNKLLNMAKIQELFHFCTQTFNLQNPAIEPKDMTIMEIENDYPFSAVGMTLKNPGTGWETDPQRPEPKNRLGGGGGGGHQSTRGIFIETGYRGDLLQERASTAPRKPLQISR